MVPPARTVWAMLRTLGWVVPSFASCGLTLLYYWSLWSATHLCHQIREGAGYALSPLLLDEMVEFLDAVEQPLPLLLESLQVVVRLAEKRLYVIPEVRKSSRGQVAAPTPRLRRQRRRRASGCRSSQTLQGSG